MLHTFGKRNCKKIESLLWEYAGGRLESKHKARVEAHLNRCVSCQTQLRTIEQIGQGLKTLRHAPMPGTQTSWTEVQARLTSAPVMAQNVAAMRRAGRYRVVIGAGAVAAMTLLWIVLAPRGGEQSWLPSYEGQDRAETQGKSNLPTVTGWTDAPATMATDIAFDKSLLSEKNRQFQPELSRPIAPEMRLVNTSDSVSEENRHETFSEHSVKRVRRYNYGRKRHRLLLARTEMPRAQQNSERLDMGMLMPAVGTTLSPEVPNYVLTSAEDNSAQRRPRAYVMDCVSTDARSQTTEASGQVGEERAW